MYEPVLTRPKNVRYLESEIWGLDLAEATRRGLSRQPGNLDEVFIHHTAGQMPDLSAAEWDDNPITFIQNLDRVARESKGYKALDYSWVIHQAKGIVTVIEGRGLHYPAATLDRNTGSKAICYAGDFRKVSPLATRAPSQLELTAGQWLVSDLRAQGILSPYVVGRAHRDNPSHPGATACCGDLLIPWVPFLMQPYQPAPSLPAPVLRFGDTGRDVRDLRDLLVLLKFAKRDGSRYTRGTVRAVKKLQAELGLAQSGVWNRPTAREVARVLKMGN